jgi:DNA-binding phage protein
VWQHTALQLLFVIESAKRLPMEMMTEEDEPSFLDAFCTILIREHLGSGRSLSQWARASGVEPRSLKRLINKVRPIGCTYGIRLCCGLQLSFARVFREAIQLKFKTPVGRRCAWRFQLLEDPSAVEKRTANEAKKIATHLCTWLARRIADSGRNFTELALQSGVERTVISRLGQVGRQNPSLQSLFDLSCAMDCQLDVLAWEVSQSLERVQKEGDHA